MKGFLSTERKSEVKKPAAGRPRRHAARRFNAAVSIALCLAMTAGTMIFAAADTGAASGAEGTSAIESTQSIDDASANPTEAGDTDADSSAVGEPAAESGQQVNDASESTDESAADAAADGTEGDTAGDDAQSDSDTGNAGETVTGGDSMAAEDNAEGTGEDTEADAADDEAADADGSTLAELTAEEASASTLPEWYTEGKKTGTFEIDSSQKLAELAELVNDGVTTFSNRTVLLTADIDMSDAGGSAGTDTDPDDSAAAFTDEDSGAEEPAAPAVWAPIGSGSSAFFAGTFDGQGHTVSGIAFVSEDTSDRYTGLFGYLTGTVRNLTINNSTFNTAGQYAGAAAGYISDSGSLTDVTITNTTVTLTAAAADAYAGLAAGASAGTLEDIEVSGSAALNFSGADVSGYAGGIAGLIAGGSAVHLVNRAAVSAGGGSDAAGVYAGGIAGSLTAVSDVINLGNSGSVTAAGGRYAYAGGLAGHSDAGTVRNCWNKGDVTASGASSASAAGGLIGSCLAGSIYNSYSSNTSVKGDVKYTGYIAGIISGDTATSADYVYWPGSGTYTSTATYGSAGAALQTVSTCRGISKIPSSSSLIKRLNTQVCSSADDETLTTELCMWKLTDESNPKSAPEFREEAPAPVFPHKPDISEESTAVGLHPSADDADHKATLGADVSNTDSDVVMTYQWQSSEDGETFKNVTATEDVLADGSANDGKSASFIITGSDTGVRYYRLRVSCSDEKADTSKSYYSSVITVTTGWRIRQHAGGLLDGSAAVTDGGAAEDIFPVLPDSGSVQLTKPASEGMFFLGYASSYKEGQSYTSAELISSYDTTGMSADAELWSVFRQAQKVVISLAAGSSKASVKEGVTDSQLEITADEGSDYIVPDGNVLFENEGYRFIGWQVTKKDDVGDSSVTDPPATDGSESDESAASDADSRISTLFDMLAAVLTDGDGTAADEDIDPDDQSGIDAATLLKPGDIWVPGTDDVIFTAVWHRMYSASYEIGSQYAEGEVPESTEAIYIEGESFELPSADSLSRKGYVFGGWKDNITYKSYKAGATYTLPEDATKLKDIVFTAQWTRLMRIEIYASENSLDISEPYNKVLEVPAGSSFKLPGQGDMKLAGYRFTGWYDLDGNEYAPEDYVLAQIDTIIYGSWHKVYNISFDKGSINDDSTADITGDGPENIEVILNEKVTLPGSTYTVTTEKEGISYYRFMGWQLKGDATAPVVKNGAEYEMIYENDITLVAQWRAMKEGMTWDGESSNKPVSGSGTESDPYLITTASELAWISQFMQDEKSDLKGVYFSLENDIDLFNWDWKPIGWISTTASGNVQVQANVFNGVFDGNGHTIYGLATEISVSGQEAAVGLFGATGSSAVISDLNLSDVDLKVSDLGSGTKECGIIAGSAEGSRIENCTVDGTITYTASSSGSSMYINNSPYVGGIVGYANKADITGCTNNAHIDGVIKSEKVLANLYAGGIAGGVKSTDIENCVNNGTVEWTVDVDESAEAYIGGIIGYSEASSKISGCENTGKVSTNTSMGWYGGIAGWCVGDISDCINSADVMLESSFTYSRSVINDRAGGGIAGRCKGDVTSCVNSGSVIMDIAVMKADHWEESRVGGIVGTENGDISACYNSGNVTFSISRNLSSYSMQAGRIKIAAGGIAGMLGNGSISNCFSSAGDVSLNFSGNDPRTLDGVTGLEVASGGIIGQTAYKSETGGDKNESTRSDFYDKNITASKSSIVNSYWLRDEGSSSYSTLPEHADGSQLINDSESSCSKTLSQASSGEIAYYLDGGTGTHRNEWTQGSSGIPELGTPSYYRAESESDDVQLSDGTNVGDVIYTPVSATVRVVYDEIAKEINIGGPYIKETKYSGTTRTDYYYQKYYNTADITLKYADGTAGEINKDNKTFVMRASDATVSVSFETDASKVDDSQIKERFLYTVETQEEQPQPEPDPDPGDKGDGGGHHGGHGSGGGRADSGSGNNDRTTPGTSDGSHTGTGNHNTSSLPVTSSDNASSDTVLVIVPQTDPNAPDTPQVEADVQPQTDAGESGGTVEEPELQEQPEPEPDQVFEVVHDTIKDNPVLMICLLILILLIIILAGYRRYRKNKA